MRANRNLLREKLGEFISKLGRNHELDEDDKSQNAKKITPKICEKRADFWCKHLSSQRNTKVIEKVDGFCGEITQNLGNYLANKYGRHVFQSENWDRFSSGKVPAPDRNLPHEQFLKAKSSIRFAALVFSKINAKLQLPGQSKELYNQLAKKSSKDLIKMLKRSHALDLELALQKEDNAFEVPEFLMVVVGLRLREQIAQFYGNVGVPMEQEETQIQSDKRKVHQYYNRFPASLVDAVDERVIFEEPGSEYGYDTSPSQKYGNDMYYRQESDIPKKSGIQNSLVNPSTQNSQTNLPNSASSLFENHLNQLQGMESEQELGLMTESQAVVLIREHQEIMTSPVGKWKTILYRLNLCALGMKGVVNGNSDQEPKISINLITHCLLINLGELEEIVNSETFQIESVPQMSRKLFSLHNQLGSFMANDFPTKAQEEEDIGLLLQFLRDSFYQIYEDLDLSAAIKVNSLSFEVDRSSISRMSTSRVNNHTPIDRFSTERIPNAESNFNSFKASQAEAETTPGRIEPNFDSKSSKKKVRSNSLFPDYEGTPTARGNTEKISFKKKNQVERDSHNIMTFGKKKEPSSQRFTDTPAKRAGDSYKKPEPVVNSDSELEEMAENIAKFKNFKRKTVESHGFLEVIQKSEMRGLKTPTKKYNKFRF